MIIVQGVFRSGTTTVFRALRRDDALRCYYEPLHPDLIDHASEATSDRPTHSKSPLYSEYAPLLNKLGSVYRANLALDHAMLAAEANAPDLRLYLNVLSTSAPSVVLQFNRAFWISEWLNRQFPEAHFLHIVRDPRSVVWSQLTTQSGQRVRMELPLIGRTIFNLSSGNLANAFSSHAYHGAYHVREYFRKGAESLAASFRDEASTRAQKDLRSVENAPPYVQALALWGAQVRVCHRQAQAAFGDRYQLIRYEDLCESAESVLEQTYSELDRRLPPTVAQYATDQIHARRLAAWKDVDGSTRRFREGIEAAGIGDLVDTLHYSSPPD